jgi:hypothetical protein
MKSSSAACPIQLKSACLSDCSSKELLGRERTHSDETFQHCSHVVRPLRTGQPSLDDCSGKWYKEGIHVLNTKPVQLLRIMRRWSTIRHREIIRRRPKSRQSAVVLVVTFLALRKSCFPQKKISHNIKAVEGCCHIILGSVAQG